MFLRNQKPRYIVSGLFYVREIRKDIVVILLEFNNLITEQISKKISLSDEVVMMCLDLDFSLSEF